MLKHITFFLIFHVHNRCISMIGVNRMRTFLVKTDFHVVNAISSMSVVVKESFMQIESHRTRKTIVFDAQTDV